MIVLISLVGIVSAAGICTLDKYDYHPEETMTFSCTCTLGNEQNKDGYIVFRNSTNVILQSTSINSGSCISSIFGATYIIPTGLNNIIGNVTFSENLTGGGEPDNWDDTSDIISDYFNISGANEVDCIITDVVATPIITIGDVGAVKFKVRDGTTGNPLVHAQCTADGYTVGSEPIIFEPYGVGDTNRVSGSNGEVGFMHEMNELIWKKNTGYLFEFHCHCLGNGTGEECYDETTGSSVGFKSCDLKVPFMTNGRDLRDVGDSILPEVISIIFIIIFFAVFGFAGITRKYVSMEENQRKTNKEQSVPMSVLGFSVAIIESMFLLFILFANRSSTSLIPLLRINFYAVVSVLFLIIFIALLRFIIKLLNPLDEMWKEDKEGNNRKWQGR